MDTLARLAFDGSERIPKFLLPVVRDRLRTGDDLRLSAAIVASFAIYCEGSDEAGRPLTIDDQRASSLASAAAQQTDDPLAFVRHRHLDAFAYPRSLACSFEGETHAKTARAHHP